MPGHSNNRNGLLFWKNTNRLLFSNGIWKSKSFSLSGRNPICFAEWYVVLRTRLWSLPSSRLWSQQLLHIHFSRQEVFHDITFGPVPKSQKNCLNIDFFVLWVPKCQKMGRKCQKVLWYQHTKITKEFSEILARDHNFYPC